MRIAAALILLAIAAPARADSYCEALLGFIHDAPANAVLTTTIDDPAGPQMVARVGLPGARCHVAPYNPTGVAKDHPAEQSVDCIWFGTEKGYRDFYTETNAHVAVCMAQPASDNTLADRLEYNSNYGIVRVSTDREDWTISVTVMPQD